MEAPVNDRPRVGLVLSGGGARGAYEVGVLRYLRERLPKQGRIDVVCGSSVGAINGAYIAATADRPRAQGRMLARVWSEMTLDRVYGFGWAQMRMLPQVLFGKHVGKATTGATIGGLMDVRFVENLIRNRIPWAGISQNLRAGVLDAFSCTATELATGISTIFVETSTGQLPHPWPVDHGQSVVMTKITAAHAVASAAIPVLFPAVRVDDQIFVDGSLRLNTPLRPALRLGANRLLVISMRHADENTNVARRERERVRFVFPSAVFMMGKMMNALMLDKLEADLAGISRTNEILHAGTEIAGPAFGARLAQRILGGETSAGYAPIHVLLVRPSADLGELAYRAIQHTRLEGYHGVMARWLRRAVLDQEGRPESDLASYLFFDPYYVKELIDLGYEDAKARHDELIDLFHG